MATRIDALAKLSATAALVFYYHGLSAATEILVLMAGRFCGAPCIAKVCTVIEVALPMCAQQAAVSASSVALARVSFVPEPFAAFKRVIEQPAVGKLVLGVVVTRNSRGANYEMGEHIVDGAL